jgi:protein gp37
VSFWPWLSNPTIAADLGRDFPLLDWIIVGGESGPNARPFDIAWALSIKNQCERASTSFYMKQLGSNAVASFVSWDTKDRAGADPSEWPEDLKRQEFPKIRLGV